ncbi:hypothetical protein [Candidatus Contubernalis alkaliaceticus]|uniref:hypothetical protein n=1 Tax=Candidatus Contubernalis alkaliaceticus TaxID=338645 RepID=UPI001F4BF023|nr:hypothetical protein [Candidatus Contubernalis alkalaceticus]UNC92357.1 hypothetical protein HUE98_09750 [Candidatus Contubernalis alkalaceticus]
MPQIGVALEESRKKDDIAIRVAKDIIIILDPSTARRLKGKIVEYHNSWHGTGFSVRRRIAKYSC